MKSMFQITGSVLALPDIFEALGEAIYTTHLAKAQAKTGPIIPPWHEVSEVIAEYVLAQARAAAAVVDAFRAACRRKRPPGEPGAVTGNPALLEDIARAIHRTHLGKLPGWPQVTKEMREWNREQAMSVTRVIDDYIANHRKD